MALRSMFSAPPGILAVLALAACSSAAAQSDEDESYFTCPRTLQCKSGQWFDEDHYLSRYPNLPRGEVEMIHYCKKEPRGISEEPSGKVIGLTADCRKTYEGEVVEGAPVGSWIHFWADGRVSERVILTSSATNRTLFDDQGNPVLVDQDSLSDQDLQPSEVISKVQTVPVRKSRDSGVTASFFVGSCSTEPTAKLRYDPVINLLKQANHTILYRGSTTRSLVVLSAPPQPRSEQFRTIYHFALRLGECSTGKGRSDCPAHITAFRKRVPLVAGILQLSRASSESDDLSAKLVDAATLTIDEAYVRCTQGAP